MVGSGFAFATWAARIPQVRDRLDLTSGQLGLVLLAIAAGSVLALPLAGPAVSRFGSRRTVVAMALLLSASLVVAGVGHLAGVAPLVVGLFFFGLANGAWDVAMNVQGAGVERRLSRSVMSRFHAGWSCGTVAGAGMGALAVAVGIPVAVHLTVVAVVVAVVVPLRTRRFLPDAAETDEETGAGSALTAWREPRTLLIGVFVLAFAFAEGAANDWVSVSLVDDHDASAAIGAVGFAVFLAAMTTARWFGPALLDRFGRVPVLRTCAAVAVAGLCGYVFAPNVPLALLGALIWGLGTSLGFPTGMSAAADDPARAAARVGVVSSIGYCAFLGGPPLIGVLGEHVTVLRALLVVAAGLAVAVAVTPALRRPQGRNLDLRRGRENEGKGS